MAVVNAWCGAPTSSGARVVTKVTGTSVRLAVSTEPSLSNPVYFGPVTPASQIAQLTATGLTPSTRYWWAVEDNGVLDTVYTGQFRTLPVEDTAASFTISVAGDAGLQPLTPGVAGSTYPDRISNDPVFDTVRELALNGDHLMFVHLGDLHYYNPGQIIGSAVADYRTCLDDVLLQPRQHELYRNVPLTWIWDDHDYGPNDSDETNPGKANAWQVYRERVPSYPLADDTAGIHHAFKIGRVQFIAWDYRSFKSPKGNTDDASKTALGASQKAWLRSILETTTAEALVILQQTAWAVPPTVGSDAWGGYNTERQELADMFTSLGWADRMIMVGADGHSVAIDSGANNAYGGFPHALIAPLDANPSGTWEGFDVVISNDYRQHGTIGVDDDGARILLTITAYRDTGVLGTYSIEIPTNVDPGPGPDPTPSPPPAVATAAIRQHVTWFGVHRSTGRIMAELPDITGDPSRVLSAYASAEMSIPVTRGGPGHVPVQLLEACTDGRSGSIVAVVNDLPLWMGLPAVRRGTGPIRVNCNTPEAYLLKRLVRDVSFVDTDRAIVALTLAQQAEDIDGLGQGLGLEYDVELTGDLITIDYKATDRQRIYDAIRDLCVGGLEFEIALDWADNTRSRIVKIMRIRRRIGRVTGTPRAMLQTGAAGSVVDYDLTESWSDRAYANRVLALGPGQGDSQPVSDPAIDLDAMGAGVPIVESVLTGGNNLTTTDLLNDYAASQLDRMRTGSSTIDVEVMLNGYPRLGVDALLGDQISYLLESDRHPAPSLLDPTDLRLGGERRMTAWTMSPANSTWKTSLVSDPTLEVA
jgi:hypothetical protein